MKRKRIYRYLALMAAFILGNYRGSIALWKEGDALPLRVFPYSVTSLPPADQQRIKDGIPIGSAEDLQQLLEDYLS